MKSRSNPSTRRCSLLPGRDAMVLAGSNAITIERMLFYLLESSNTGQEICFQRGQRAQD